MKIYILVGASRYSDYGEHIVEAFKFKKDVITFLKDNNYRYNKKEKLYVDKTSYIRVEKHNLIMK